MLAQFADIVGARRGIAVDLMAHGATRTAPDQDVSFTVQAEMLEAFCDRLNLNQVDLRASKRFKFAQYRFRIDVDAYNVLNSNWPFTVTNTFSTLASSQWLRPTNVLQSRFFKLGAQFDF